MITKTITPAEARKILGDRAAYMNDKQIETILNTLYDLCDRVVSNIEKGKA